MDKVKVRANEFAWDVEHYFKSIAKHNPAYRLGQFITNKYAPKHKLWSDLFYCPNSKFWELVFNYIELT